MMIWAALALALAGAAAAAAWWLKPGADRTLRRIELADPLASADRCGAGSGRLADRLFFRCASVRARPRRARAAGSRRRSRHGRAAVLVAGRAHDRILCRWRDQHDPGGRRTGAAGLPNPGDRVRAIDFAWRPDGTIFFTVSRDSLYTVPAAGGTPAVYLAIDPKTEIEFTSVSPLPDNRLIVTTRIREPSSFRTELVGSGSDRRRTTIVADPDVTFVKYDPHGVLLFRRRGPNNGIWAVPFDEARVDLARAVEIAPRGTYFQADATGSALIGLPPPAATSELVWLSRTGEISPVPGTPVNAGSDPGVVARRQPRRVRRGHRGRSASRRARSEDRQRHASHACGTGCADARRTVVVPVWR